MHKYFGFLLICTCFIAMVGVCDDNKKDYGTLTEVVGVISDLNKKSPTEKRIEKCGGNMLMNIEEIPAGDSKEHLKIGLRKKTNSDDNSQNWFLLDQNVISKKIWGRADGISISMSLNKSMKWWFSVGLRTKDGKKFIHYPLMPMTFSENVESRSIPFKDLKCNDKSNRKLNPSDIVGIEFSGSGHSGDVNLYDVSLYKDIDENQWIGFSTDPKYGCNIFELNEPVKLLFEVAPVYSGLYKQFKYVVTDYNGKNVAEGIVDLKEESREYDVSLETLKNPGYYEVRAYGVDNDGKHSEYSNIIQKGTVPGAFATFAIMPHTVAENAVRMSKAGEDAFFGLHNPRPYLHIQELMGYPWMFEYGKWQYDENLKPQRENLDDEAAWVNKKLNKSGVSPEYIYSHTSLLSAQGGGPNWALNEDRDTPPHYKEKQDMNAYLRDSIRYHMQRFPHIKHRTYGVLWEPEWHSAEHTQHVGGQFKPIYQDKTQFVEIVKNTSELIKELDPDATIVGPSSMMFLGDPWFEDFFKSGLLDHIDELSIHCYAPMPPEIDGIPDKLQSLRELMVKYVGKELPIFNTEAGFHSTIGTEHKLREQAESSVRYTIILKGEGVKRHLHFYPYDIPESYGISFYLGNMDKFNFDVSENGISPKPSLCALATCSSELLGSKPVRHIRDWGRNLWGYVFEKDNEPILVVWQPFKSLDLSLVAGDVQKIKVTDMMGNVTSHDVVDGLVNLTIGTEPIYISGLSKEIYFGHDFNQQSVNNKLPTINPGQSKEIELKLPPSDKSKITSASTWGGVSVSVESKEKLKVSVPYDIPEMSIPVIVSFENGPQKVQWINIGSRLDISSVNVAQQDGQIGLEISCRNYTDMEQKFIISVSSSYDSRWIDKSSAVEPSGIQSLFIPVNIDIDPTKPLDIDLKLSSDDLLLTEQKQVYFLSAYKDGENNHDANKFPNRVDVEGIGASGKTDEVSAEFSWDETHFNIELNVKDQKFYQTIQKSSLLWKEDSIQMAFDTDPENDQVYNPLAGVMTKKISEFTFALASQQPVVFRNTSYNKDEMPEGEIKDAGFDVEIFRDEKSESTVYSLKVPWDQIGLEQVQPGKAIGISILVNDADGETATRKTIEIFGGILSAKDYNLFGRVTLR